jgi:ATP-dependent helicase HrpB
MNFSDLPIQTALPELKAALDNASAVVLSAPPGAGKSTGVPLALLDAPWLEGKSILMLEPRRLAARNVAARMAFTLKEETGGTIGYRVRLESRVSSRTRIEVVTEGILIRRLQSDPDLSGVGLVIFDEFHERALDADLGLALCLEAQAALRPDLKLLVMSATLDIERIAALLGGAPVIKSEGRAFPVEIRHLEPRPNERLEDFAARAVRRALAEESGSLLVFLPGEGEIRRVEAKLADDLPPDADLAPLYGALPPEAQDKAIRPPAQGRRKIVLATNIAETSLTIEGVRVVIDGGYKRAARFDAVSGMTRLATVRVSKAAAEQRKGRAGRLEPGICYRLWPEAESRALEAFDRPEILEADPAPLALALAQWGAADPSTLAWLDPPPSGAYALAIELLKRLEAINEEGRITQLGRKMAELPLHPRLAHMVLRGQEDELGGTACDLAALLGERDIVSGGRDVDARLRLDLIARPSHSLPGGMFLKRGALERVRAAARDLRRRIGVDKEPSQAEAAGELLALAYPDRVAKRRGGLGRFHMSGGRGAILPESDPLAGVDYLAVAEVDGAEREARIFLAAPIARAEIDRLFFAQISTRDVVEWDSREGTVIARRRTLLGSLILDDKPLPKPDPATLALGLLQGVREIGLDALPWSPATRSLQGRTALARKLFPEEDWPDFSDATLIEGLGNWLLPHLAGMKNRADLTRLDLFSILENELDWEKRRRLDAIFPTHLEVPSGSSYALDYLGGEEGPVLAVKLQELFGLTETPTVGNGRAAVTLHLLSPAQRPLAVTRDLKSFWINAYPAVRGEMRGRYPKHPWPDDPLSAVPTRLTKKKFVLLK